MIFRGNLKAEQVFTPKGKFVNDDMYIKRDALEKAFKKSQRKNKHVIIHGESGCGKTWLYKKIFKEQGIYYEVLNAATINSKDSINDAIQMLINRLSPDRQKGYKEEKSANINAAVAKGGLKNVREYETSQSDPFLELLKAMFTIARKTSYLVVENIEHIVSNECLVKELSSLLLYLDDTAYAKYNVQIILVGTPSNLRDYFAQAVSSQTIINRVQEIPEISVLTKAETEKLVIKGFFKLLNLDCVNHEESGFNKTFLLNGISWFSANVPQYIHEICLEIALEAEENQNKITNDLYVESLRYWVQEALVSENTRLELHMNSKNTKSGRRNQVIYTIGSLNTNEFSAAEVEERLRKEFPSSTNGKSLNMSANLSILSQGNSPLIRKTPTGNRYRFLDPKIKIMVRWMLTKSDQELISIKTFDESIKL